eukprot:gene9461-biopygen177
MNTFGCKRTERRDTGTLGKSAEEYLRQGDMHLDVSNETHHADECLPVTAAAVAPGTVAPTQDPVQPGPSGPALIPTTPSIPISGHGCIAATAQNIYLRKECTLWCAPFVAGASRARGAATPGEEDPTLWQREAWRPAPPDIGRRRPPPPPPSARPEAPVPTHLAARRPDRRGTRARRGRAPGQTPERSSRAPWGHRTSPRHALAVPAPQPKKKNYLERLIQATITTLSRTSLSSCVARRASTEGAGCVDAT